MTDTHHFKRRAHAIRRLIERYGIHVSMAEYEAFAKAAQHAPQLSNTNVVKTTLQDRTVYCSIQRGEVSTFLSPEQVNWLVARERQSRRVETRGLMSLGDLL